MFDLAIFTALGWERRAVTDALLGQAAQDGAGTWGGRLGDGASCVVVQTGVGRERARTAAAALPPARLFLACGCAGALADWLRAGDLVVADRVDVVAADGRTADRVAAQGPALAAWATSRGFRVHQGAVASTLGVLRTGAAKAAAGAAGALVVEMESAAVAAEARGRGIPFVGLRVVLDHAGQLVPIPAGVVDERTGEIRPGRALAGLTIRPWLWPALARLGRQQRVAARKLGAFMAALVREGGMEALAGAAVPVAAAGGAEEGL
jgi:adenosylhomocysteine nucleosidase